MNLAVLASGRGSNLAALLAARDAGTLPARFVLVGSDHPDAPALQLARDAGIATFALRPKDFPDRPAFDRALFNRIEASGADLLVLAGFMRVIDGAVLGPWAGRVLNIHPSLLPKYRGLHTHRRAIEAGDAEHGASVHFVTAELDGGPLIAQARIAIEPGDDEDALAARLLPWEHRLLPAVVALLAEHRLALTAAGVTLDGTPLKAPLRLTEHGLQ
ncbi:MAG: phosphoribosylglycinamide formyltransferase [Rhodanobacter sp.]|nr:MAG: phosphoribosylglycinamide formyltransferase [Rhodanobacter sp.]TAM13297.1 MAG: phosphoribosylglycinamide formyltransferase [Rhodanobacter sp.]TAM35419.1 MAG: phosphoribosylglycinamide formyltransferase [Rhodanobacter sp.]